MLEIEATEQNVLFPIPFTQWCVASGSRVTGTGGNPTTLGANAAFHQIATLTHVAVFSIEAQEYYLFTAGVQQWGYLTNADSGTLGTIIDLPCPVTYAIGVSSTSTGSGADIATFISVNLNNQTLEVARRPTSGNVAWFIIGYQQWGFNYEVKSNNPFNLPISFSETIFCVVATSANLVSVGAWWYKDGATLDKIAIGIGADDTPATGNFTYLSLGKQQWGYEQNNELVTLLLPYTTAYIPVGCAALLDAEFSLTIQDNSSFYRPVRSTAYWLTIGS